MSELNINYSTSGGGGHPGAPDVRSGGARLSGLLGIYTKFVAAVYGKDGERRLMRFLLQDAARAILPKERIKSCLRWRIPGVDEVEIFYSGQFKRAHYGGLMVCGSVWGCPVCSAKITERRRVELSQGLENWKDKGSVVMASFTFQHTAADRLDGLIETLTEGYRRFQNTWAWRALKEKYKIVGSINCLEVTWGAAAGWHPHKHALFFLEAKGCDLVAFQSEISALFRASVAKLGGYSHPDIGVIVTDGNHEAAKKYIAKWGIDFEMAKAPVKSGRGQNYSPFELLAWAAGSGDLQPVRLFQEYFYALKGSRQLRYSAGLRHILGLDADLSDQEVAERQDADAILLASLSEEIWRRVVFCGKRGELLEVASSGDVQKIHQFLEDLDMIS